MSENPEANDAASKTATEDTEPLSLLDLAGGFMHDGEAEEEEIEEVESTKAESTDETPESEEDAPEAEPEEEAEEDLSILGRLAPDGLTEEEATALSVELGSGSGQRIGKLTAEKKALGERLDTVLAELSKKKETLGQETDEENPFASSTTIEELEEINTAATETVEVWGDILEDSRDAVADEVIGSVGETEITKAQARQMVKNAKAALRKHLPARLRSIRENESFEAARVQNLEHVKAIHPWVADDSDSEKRTAFDAASVDLLAEVRKLMPHRLGQIDLMLADHCDASFDRQNAKTPAKAQVAKAKRKAPPSPGGAGGARSRPAGKAAKANREEQFLQSAGSVEDLTNYFL